LARFLSGSLLTSSGTLDSLAALQGETATSNGAADDIQTGSLDISALSALQVTVPGGTSLPLGTLVQLGLANQYAEADANGLSRAASGAVSDTGVVDTTGTGAFPSDATLDIASVLPSEAQSVLTTANLQVGAIAGVAALDPGVSGGPTTSCSNLSIPVNCRDYSIANASLDLASPAIGTAVSSINTALGTASTAVNGLGTSLLSSLNGVINGIGALLGGQNTLSVNLSVDLQTALSSVLQGSISSGGVTLDLANGTITVDLAAVLGGLHQPPNTPLLSSAVINAVVSSLNTILTQLQTTINTTATTALDSAPVTISGGVCDPLGGCAAPLGGTLSISYAGTLQDLASGTADIGVTGTGTIPALLGVVLDSLSGTIATTLGGVAQPVLTTAISTVSTGTANALTTLSDTLDPALQAISSTVGATLNVQEPGAVTGASREVALRISLLGGAAATIDLGRAEVGPDVVAVAPTVTGLSPAQGPDTGGTTVTITGTGFTGATAVTFDTTAATSFTIVNGTTITATTPAHTPGPVDVTVTSPGGTSAPQTFTYLAAPTATTLSPTHGPLIGGTTVTITGTGFTQPGLAVDFGGTSVTPTVDSDTQITVASPTATTAGPVNVVVSTDGGAAPALQFTYDPVPVPAITTPTPGSNVGPTPTIGGTSTGPDGDTITVTDGDTTLCTATLTSGAWTCTPTTPLTPGSHTITATETDTANHPSNPSEPITFTVLASPAVTGLSPAQGPDTGGTTVTITGTGFTGATAVTFDTTAATSFTIVNGTTITATTPAHTPGPVDVTVTSPGGTSAPQTFTYLAAPTATTLSPTHGPLIGGTTVTITGTGFTQPGLAVDFGGTSVTPTVDSDTQITVASPTATTAGPVNVVVSTDGGAAPALQFTYDPVPVPAITTPHPRIQRRPHPHHRRNLHRTRRRHHHRHRRRHHPLHRHPHQRRLDLHPHHTPHPRQPHHHRHRDRHRQPPLQPLRTHHLHRPLPRPDDLLAGPQPGARHRWHSGHGHRNRVRRRRHGHHRGHHDSGQPGHRDQPDSADLHHAGAPGGRRDRGGLGSRRRLQSAGLRLQHRDPRRIGTVHHGVDSRPRSPQRRDDRDDHRKRIHRRVDGHGRPQRPARDHHGERDARLDL
jgi:hypothetical protein